MEVSAAGFEMTLHGNHAILQSWFKNWRCIREKYSDYKTDYYFPRTFALTSDVSVVAVILAPSDRIYVAARD